MEFNHTVKNYLHVKVDPKTFDAKAFSHQALLNFYEDEGKIILVFEPQDIDEILRALLDFSPALDVLEVGLYPTLGPTVGYRLAFGPLRIVCPGAGLKPEEGELVLQTDFSFGSGFHPTTKLSLSLLLLAFEKRRPLRVFDLGTGSGILSLCAAKLGASQVLAVDIDERAVSEAYKNVCQNGFENQILVAKGSLSCARANFFDLLLANLTIGTILTLGPTFPQVLKEGGWMILSGFTTGQVEEVMDLFPGATLLQEVTEEGWAGLLISL